MGYGCWNRLYVSLEYPNLFYVASGAATLSLLLTVWVGGIITQSVVEGFRRYLPRDVDLARKSFKESSLHVRGSSRRGARGACSGASDGALRGGEDGSRAEGRHAHACARRVPPEDLDTPAVSGYIGFPRRVEQPGSSLGS